MTKKPLAEMIPDLLKHVSNHQGTLDFNFRLYKIYEGQIREEIEESLTREMVSKGALVRAKQRIPSLNITKKAVDKLSKVYSQAPVRLAGKSSDQEILDNLSRTLEIDNTMQVANTIYNLHRSVALEPYVEDGKQRLRALASHQFLPYSDDDKNPMNMTVFIKFMGSELVNRPMDSRDGVRKTDRNDPVEVTIIHLYSDEEFLIIDSNGTIRQDKMNDHAWSDGINRIGIIPQVYINKSKFELVPYPNKSLFDISILIPKLLTDLNYAAQFLSHSIIWARNADLTGAEIHPDSILGLGSSMEGEGNPEIGTIEPKVDIERVLQLIEFQLAGFLSTFGIKAASVGSMMPGREASGFAKAMDEGDATSERKVQSEEFKSYEKVIWKKLNVLQSYWSRTGLVDEKRLLSPDFDKTFTIQFGEVKHLMTERERIDRVDKLLKMGLATKKQALKDIFPDITDEQLDKRIEELEVEDMTTRAKDAAQSGQPSNEAPQFNGQTEVPSEPDFKSQPNKGFNNNVDNKPNQTIKAAVPGDNQVALDNAPIDPTSRLNGAQVRSLLEIVDAVVKGQIPRETAIRIMEIAFAMDSSTADTVLGKIGKGFKPKPEPAKTFNE